MRNLIRMMLDIARLVGGSGIFLATGKTPDSTYQSMIRLFCRSRGRSNDVLTSVVRLLRGRAELPYALGILGKMEKSELARAIGTVTENGYHVFERAVPEDVCDRLLAFALNTPSSVRANPKAPGAEPTPTQRVTYDRQNPLGVRYDFSVEDVISNADVQRLMSDASILAIAQEYLGSVPIADVTNMWWHTAFSDQPDEEAAQFFHFDMDRIKWLKFFIYLTDVTPDSGPHSFVRGSHRTAGIPANLLAKGYARLSDEEVFKHFRKEDVVEFVAPRGTVIVEDTRGLHKGHAVRRGDRLMLQLQFSNSLFGGTYPPAKFRSLSAPLREMVRAYPTVYANYLDHAE
jgi:ectoine hydroxylase-related dioxygenase (phytanoyl-CoA dioxygenase family)